MKKILFPLLAAVIFLTSCGADPVKFNDAIVKEQMSLQNPVVEYANKLGQVIAGDSTINIKNLGDSLVIKIDKSLDVVKGLQVPSGGEKFKEVAIDYFESAKKVVSMGDKVKSLGSNPTEEQARSFFEDFMKLDKEMEAKANAVLTAQAEFAKDKKMTIR